MNLRYLYDHSESELPIASKRKSWFEWIRLRRRKPNSEEEINEFYDLISNVYESIDDQARAILLSLSKLIRDENSSITIENKIQAIIAIGHLLCCSHMQIKSSTNLYSKLLIHTFVHQDSRIRLASIIAIGEISIDNLSFQMKLNKIGMIPKLFDTIKVSLEHAGRTIKDVNIDSKIVAWSCYTIVNICANCIPNIILLREIIPNELDSLNEAMQLEIWSSIWHENYARTVLEFADQELISHLLSNAIQLKQNLSENLDNPIEHFSTNKSTSNHHSQRCTIL